MHTNAPRLLELDHADAANVALAGGKGANLARLRRAGFRVPDARTLVASAYDEWVAASGIAFGDASRGDDLALSLAGYRTLLERVPVPHATIRSLAHGLPAELLDAPVAVRSSGVAEDGASAAFAGQHDTFLGVRGLDEIVDAVRRCWLSAWSEHAVRYRLDNGHAVADARMAVVVQRMVAADAAGVAFTLDPVTGETDRVTVDAARGLGESVVSGEEDTDQWHVAKGSHAVLRRRIGVQAHALVQRGDTVRREALSERDGAAPCLDDAGVAAVAALAERAEVAFGFPQDIEWALADGELHLLQARPVTRFPARWTRAESAERFPDAVTPLTWDYTAPGFHASLAHSLALMGLPPIEGAWFERFDGHVYGNATAISLYTRFAELDVRDFDALTRELPALLGRFAWVRELPTRWAADLDRYLVAIGRLGAVDVRILERSALAEHLARIDAVGRAYFLPNIAISMTQGLVYRALHRVAALALGTDAAGPTLAALTSCCDTRTHRVNAELDGLCAMARTDTALTATLAAAGGAALVATGALAAHPAFEHAFEAFIADHGHRETHFDAFHPTWGDAPGIVLDLLRAMLAGPTPSDTRDAARRRAQAAAEDGLVAAVPESLRTFVRALAATAREYTALDDLEHYQTTRLTPPFRRALVEIGERLRDERLCDAPTDVFFLRRATLEGWLSGDVPPDAIAAEIRSLRAEHERRAASTPPWSLVDDAGPDADGDSEGDFEGGTGSGRTWRGVAGSPGIARGTVCVVRSPADFARFRPGSILVARTTNPAWTPLFRTACAVVTECGGPLSHGAVTARECGIPAVLAVRGALERFVDGAGAVVDGGRGTIELLEPA